MNPYEVIFMAFAVWMVSALEKSTPMQRYGVLNDRHQRFLKTITKTDLLEPIHAAVFD